MVLMFRSLKAAEVNLKWANKAAALILTFLACALTISPIKASNNVTLIVGGKAAPFEVSPYVADDGTVMAPVDFVRLLGGYYSVSGDSDVLITSATGKTFKQSFEHVQDRFMVPLLTTAEQLGAATTWSPSTDTFILQAKLEMAQVTDGHVSIATSYPVYYKTQTLSNPDRLVVDIFGADLDSPAATIPANCSYVTHIRTGQLDPQTVRLVLDLTHPIHFQVGSSLQTNSIQLALNTDQTVTTPVPSLSPAAVPVPPQTAQSTPTPSTTPAPSATPPGLIPLPPITSVIATAPPTKIVDVQYKSVSSNIYQVVVTTSGPTDSADQMYHAFLLQNPNRLAFDISNSEIDLAAQAKNLLVNLLPTDDNSLFKSVRWGMVSTPQATNARVVIDLLEPIVYTVSTTPLPDNSGVQYTITIEESAAGASNSIAGKIIIVDPGHGGKDSGAPGAGGIFEKNFTLAIAKQVRDALIAAGAHPIMTRSDDTFIPLDDRSQMGIDNHADYFISIHCDSSGEQNSHSGDTVYYHGDDATCRALARSIAARLGQLDISIQSDGIKSDYVRFPGVGFSVLRKSPEPAVLVECGYVNDDSDAKCLEDPGSQQQIAEGIVAGLRDFVANQ